MPPLEERAECIVLATPALPPGEDLLTELRGREWSAVVELDPYHAMAALGTAVRGARSGTGSSLVVLVATSEIEPALRDAIAAYLPEVELLNWDGAQLHAETRARSAPPDTPGSPPAAPGLRLSRPDMSWGRPPLGDEEDTLRVQVTHEELDMLLAPDDPTA